MNYTLVLAAIVLGLASGWLGNWAADHLPAWQTASAPGRVEAAPWPRRTRVLYVAMVVAFAATVGFAGPDPVRIAIGWLYAAFLLTVLVIDFEQRRVLNIMVGPAAIVVLALSLLPQTPTLHDSLLGAAAGLGLFLLVYLISRAKLGMGDVKLAGLIGLMLGYPAVINALVLGIILGAAGGQQ